MAPAGLPVNKQSAMAGTPPVNADEFSAYSTELVSDDFSEIPFW
jgi:hypothetical protein